MHRSERRDRVFLSRSRSAAENDGLHTNPGHSGSRPQSRAGTLTFYRRCFDGNGISRLLTLDPKRYMLDLTQLPRIPRLGAGFDISFVGTQADSRYFFPARVNAPVQWICGGNDPRCTANDSLDARDKLIEPGKEVQVILYEDEGHVFLNIDTVRHSEKMRVEF